MYYKERIQEYVVKQRIVRYENKQIKKSGNKEQESNKQQESNKEQEINKEQEFRISKDMPILDLIMLIIAFVTLFITILIGVGIINAHKHIKRNKRRRDKNVSNLDNTS